MAKEVSIIVPVYNVEKYLRTCLDSILHQTFQDFELILVDDGSTDLSGHICDEYAAKDDRIIVIHKQNEGVARARNSALDVATGDYISFVDSDDWLSEDAYEYYIENIKKYKADCIVGGCQAVIDRKGNLEYLDKKIEDAKCLTSTGAMKSVLRDGSAIWNRLFTKKIFGELRFPVGRINDDEVTVLHAYALCNRVVFLGKITYYYRLRENSITTSSFSMKKVDVFYNSKENLEYVLIERPDLKEHAEAKFVKAGLYCLFNLIKMKPQNDDIKKQKKEAIKYIKKELKNKASSIRKNRRIPFKYKAAVSIIR